MYLGKKSITLLKAFISGYYFARQTNNVAILEEIPPFGQFHDWIARYYNWESSTAGWNNIILQEFGDEAKALDVFFELLELFKQRLPILKHRVFLSSQHTSTRVVRRYRYVNGEKIELSPPQEIRIVQYTTDSGFYLFQISQERGSSEEGYFETEELAMEQVYKEFQVTWDEWEAIA
ncbi:hypothetical protein H6F50_10610 [Coleofasciculus sp. FACHB-712]|uniref:hypothetical protein n=1 Tax=Coleofasciculus sp. FACHB-712 TaxID=2692789 RepID=UPI00168508A8|nr:hypothetical protein [Coleofasciculus sp. FACHB-712]MBD1942803.1 hypothetical protein [Coleofasciculus sp. FACHB-712]